MYYSKKPKEEERLTENLRLMLREPELCLTCQMELLPHRDLEGTFYFPKEYCDSRCRDTFKEYKGWFLSGRVLADVAYLRAYYSKSTHTPLPNIDLRL